MYTRHTGPRPLPFCLIDRNGSRGALERTLSTHPPLPGLKGDCALVAPPGCNSRKEEKLCLFLVFRLFSVLSC